MRARNMIVTIAVFLLFSAAAEADIEIHKEHSFDARAGATVVVDVSFHNVEVTARPGNTVNVVVDLTISGDGSSSKRAAEDLQPEFSDEGKKLIIRSTRDGGWSWKKARARGKVVIEMPPGMDLLLDLSSGSCRINGDFGDAVVRFDASSGSLTANGAMRELHSDFSSGSVNATVYRPLEAFSADASSGSIRLTGGALHAKVETSSGSMKLRGLRGDAKLGSSSGSITAHWDTISPDASVNAEASSGSVTLQFPTGTELDGLVEVSSGGIHTDFPGQKGKKSLALSGGDNAVMLRVSTSSGSVKLQAN